MPTKFDARQTILRSTPNIIGAAANISADTLLTNIDADFGQLFEDRNIFLTQGGLITFTGTQVQFTEALALEVNSKIAGGAPVIISLGSTTRTVSVSGRMVYAVIDRTLGTATVTDDATTLPVVSNANQEVFLLAKRQDAADGTKRLYWRNGMAINEGQTVRLGASGSGGGAGLGDDINTLRFRASFSDDFAEGPTNNVSAVNNSLTTAVYNAAGALYRLSYDASKTVTGTGTSMTLSATPSYTVAAGDMLIVGSEARRITAVATQTSYTIEAAFSANPSVAAACVSQAVHTNDLRAHTENGTGLAISAVISDAISTFMLRYRDSVALSDTVWDFPGSAIVAFSASADNSSWGSVMSRVTSISAQEPIRSVPVSGSQFRARFFAAATSGSGAVNLLDYKAYLHEEGGVAGTTMNQAYCLTSGAGSSVNCSVSSATGKTRITTTWAFATGVNSGTQQGQIEVYVDGKLLPRYINDTLTPNGYYKEISAQVIELDADYSGVGLEVDIKQSVNVVDTTSQNSTNLSYLQDMSTAGFQGFVDESARLTAVNGTPAAGQFRSTVTNRASIPDLANDLRVRMGVDRIPIQQIVQLQNEFGPSGEPVWGALNDDRGLIRFVGNWFNITDSNGVAANTSSNNPYLEVTFYGTGINLLSQVYTNAALDLRVSVDGGSEGSNIWISSSSPLSGRNYSSNQIINMASGLSLGVHTVRLRQAVDGTGYRTYGFEVLNESANVNVRPGTAYTGGKKLVSSAASSVAYNGGTFDSVLRAGASTSFSSARGARVLTYIKSDGTIGKSAYLTNAAQANLASADHTFEDVARTYHFREFGAGRSDDFSLTFAAANKAFTLDDGTTTLVCQNYTTGNFGLGDGVYANTGSGDFLTVTFVGTGLDVVNVRNATSAQTYTVSVDGTNIVTSTAIGGSGLNNTIKIVSGLPYGTHTVRFLSTSGGNALVFSKFIVYQPKKPSLPTGAVELADYNVMADFVANSTAGLDTIAVGVLRKQAAREMVYVNGTGGSLDWAISGPNSNSTGGFQFDSNRQNSYLEYTFFGTGFEFRFRADTNRSANISVTLNGLSATTANYPTLVSSVYGTGVAFSSGTLDQLDASPSNGAGLRISGLPIGRYTVRFNNNTASSFIVADALDIITPLHSHVSTSPADLQNTLPIGSESIADSRRLSPVKSESPKKNWVQAVGVTSNPTTTSSSYVPCPDMSCTINTSGGPIVIDTIVRVQRSTLDASLGIQVYVNGVLVGTPGVSDTGTVNRSLTLSIPGLIVLVSAGTHKIDVYWATGSGTLTATGGDRRLTVREI